VSKRSRTLPRQRSSRDRSQVKTSFGVIRRQNGEGLNKSSSHGLTSRSRCRRRASVSGHLRRDAQKVIAALQARQAPDMSVLSEANWFRFTRISTSRRWTIFDRGRGTRHERLRRSFLTEGQRQASSGGCRSRGRPRSSITTSRCGPRPALRRSRPKTYTELSEWGPKLVQKTAATSPRGVSSSTAANYISWYFQGRFGPSAVAYSNEDFEIQITEAELVKP
jgi:hypothetical protein